MYGFTKSFLYHLIMTYVLLFTVILIAAFKPYKRPLRNTIDIVLFLIAISCNATFVGIVAIPYLTPTLVYFITILLIYGIILLSFRTSISFIVLLSNNIKCRKLCIRLSSSLESSLLLDSNRDEECRSLLN